MDERSLTALLERTALGDRRAFERLYRQSAPCLMAVCLRVLQDRKEAEAVLEDAYVRIWRYAERFGAAGVAPSTWMAAIARCGAIERLRATRAPAATMKAAEAVADATTRSEDRALTRGETALGALSAEDARFVRLAYFGGLSYGALAERDGTPKEAVRARLARLPGAIGEGRGVLEDRLEASEYVLSLMDPAERRTFERVLLDDPALAAAVWRVEEALAPLARQLKIVRPGARVWRAVTHKTVPQVADATRRPRRRTASGWRAVASVASLAAVAALCLLLVMVWRPEILAAPEPAMVAALVGPDGGVTLARLTAEGGVRAEPVAAALPAGQEAVLWLVREGVAPTALGILSREAPTAIVTGAAAGDLVGARLRLTAEAAGDMLPSTPAGEILAEGPIHAI